MSICYDVTRLKDCLFWEASQKLLNMPKLTLAIILEKSGDTANNVYARNLIKLCGRLDIDTFLFTPIDAEHLYSLIDEANKNSSINGIIIMQPLSFEFDRRIYDMFAAKDVEGLSTYNMGKMYCNDRAIVPMTPRAVIDIMYDMLEGASDFSNSSVCIIGRSLYVGKALAVELINRNATVTLYHSHSPKNYINALRHDHPDFVITAIDKPEYFNITNFDSGTRIIDVGTCLGKDGKIVGNLSRTLYNNDMANIIYTKVPGGVGVLTQLECILNLITLAKNQGL